MSSLLKDVGAIAGLASFLGLALVALLYFAQARDIRRLRENASFLVEGDSENGETGPVLVGSNGIEGHHNDLANQPVSDVRRFHSLRNA